MSVLLVFLGATTASLAGAVLVGRCPPRQAWPLALRGGLAVMFLVTGVTHFVLLRADLVAMVPPPLPNPELLVTITGVLELAGAVGLLRRRAAAWAGGGLALLLVAMFPANVYAALSGQTLGGEPATGLLPRSAMQVLYVTAAVTVAVTNRDAAAFPAWLHGVTVSLPRATGPVAGDEPGVVLVSRLQLRSIRHVPGFLVAALRLRAAFRRAPGGIALDLAAQPLTGQFWTWSRWTDEKAMNRYVRSPGHDHVMRAYRSRLRTSTFRFLAPGDAPPHWTDVRKLTDEAQPVVER